MRSWLFVVFSSLALSACFVEDAQKVADSGSDGGSGGGSVGGGGGSVGGGGGGGSATDAGVGPTCGSGVVPTGMACGNPLTNGWTDTCNLAVGERCTEVGGTGWSCVTLLEAKSAYNRFACLPFDTCFDGSYCSRGLCSRFLDCTNNNCAFDVDCESPHPDAGCSATRFSLCQESSGGCTTLSDCSGTDAGTVCDISQTGSWRCAVVPGKPLSGSCTTSSDCAAGLTCDGSSCKVAWGYPASSDADCASPHMRNHGICLNAAGTIPIEGLYTQASDGKTCADKGTKCSFSTDCCAGFTCQSTMCEP